MPSPRDPWQPHLGAERVVEGIHYGWLMHDHFARYHLASEKTRGKTVLDIATGTGYGANVLRSTGAALVAAADLNHDALVYARNRYGTDGLLWLEADAYALPMRACFDVVVSFETIEHLMEPDRFLREVIRVLHPDGVFLVSTPLNVGEPYISPHHEIEYTLPQFRELLLKHFENVEMLGHRRVLRERIRLLGRVADGYQQKGLRGEAVSLPLFRLMNAINKAPNAFLAWASGCGEKFRRRMMPIDAPVRRNPFVADHYYVMIGVCTKPRR